MNQIEFSKYQGLGNDFIIIDCRINDISSSNVLSKNTVINICHRRYGIGADGIIFVLSSATNSYVRMKIINSNGTEAEMCGNGIRCLVKYLIDKDNINKNEFNIDTLAGVIKSIHDNNNNISVNMGVPIINPLKIPTNLEIHQKHLPEGEIKIGEKDFKIYAIGMGNPHLITYLEDINNVPISTWGPILENNHEFPSKTNVHFTRIINRNNIEILVWERGAGETSACGTGACAVVAASIILDKCDSKVKVKLPGGFLNINWPNCKGDIYMQGPAKYVYDGIFSLTDFI